MAAARAALSIDCCAYCRPSEGQSGWLPQEQRYPLIVVHIADPAKGKVGGSCTGSGQGTCADTNAECTGTPKACACKTGYSANGLACGKFCYYDFVTHTSVAPL